MRSIKPIIPGQALTADQLNSIKSEVAKRMTGGKGINVSNVGNRIIVSRKRDQIIPRGQPFYGQVWKFTLGLGAQWTYNAYTDIAANPELGSCLDLTPDSNGVSCIFGNASPINGGSFRIRIDSSGNRVWYKVASVSNNSPGRRGSHDTYNGGSYVTNLSHGYYEAVSHVIADGSTNWELPFHLPGFSYETYGCAFDGSLHYIMERLSTSPTTSSFYSVTTGAFKTLLFTSNLQYPDMMICNSLDLWCSGLYTTAGAVTYQVWKANTSGTVIWGFKTATSTTSTSQLYGRLGFSAGCGTDCYVDGSNNVYATGHRSNTWTGSAGVYASLWVLDDSGVLQWTFDSGRGLFGVCVDETNGYVYVCGDRSNGWPGAAGQYATIWKLDILGVLIDTYDTGTAYTPVTTYDQELARMMVIRQEGTALYVGGWSGGHK